MENPDKHKILKHLTEDVYVRVGRSKIHGVGLIAVRDIPEGADPFKNLYEPDTIPFTDEELAGLPPAVRDMVDDYFGKEDGLIYIPVTGMNPLDLLHFINHSDTPNVKTINEGWTFCALREIKAGEELFSDYSTYDEGYKNADFVKK